MCRIPWVRLIEKNNLLVWSEDQLISCGQDRKSLKIWSKKEWLVILDWGLGPKCHNMNYVVYSGSFHDFQKYSHHKHYIE